MKMNASNNLSVILASVLIVTLWHNSFVLAIRTPYFSTGKFAERDVDTGRIVPPTMGKIYLSVRTIVWECATFSVT